MYLKGRLLLILILAYSCFEQLAISYETGPWPLERVGHKGICGRNISETAQSPLTNACIKGCRP